MRLIRPVAALVAGLLLASCTDDYCAHYGDWIDAEGEADRIEMRYGEDARHWPDAALDRWTDATVRAGTAHLAMWEEAPNHYTLDRIRRECSG